MLLEDEQMTLGFRGPENVNEKMVEELKKYFKNKKCAYEVKLILLTIYNKETMEPLEPEHYCVIIKPTSKYHMDKDNFNIFNIMKPYFEGDADFLDFSVIGYRNTMQIFDEGKGFVVYS